MRAIVFVCSLLAGALAACGDSTPTAPARDGGAPVDAGPPAAPYTLRPFEGVRISSVDGDANVRRASAPIALTGAPFARVTLRVALTTTCFPFEQWRTNPPPPGQNYPADCDAFDRNFEVTLDEPVDGGPPAFELVRAITPFGGPLDLEVDVTDLANARPGAHTLTVTIPTYSDGAGRITGSRGGWTVSATLDVQPGPAPRRVLQATPLVNTSLGPPGAAEARFSIPAGARRSVIEYRVTGHGGAQDDVGDCIGPAEEFCRRTHTVTLDGEPLADPFTPWRTDCATGCTTAHYGPADGGFNYCAQNPTGDPRSVRAPRANWCPGSVTPPIVWERPDLVGAGVHTFATQIDGVVSGGSWRTSATLYVYGD